MGVFSTVSKQLCIHKHHIKFPYQIHGKTQIFHYITIFSLQPPPKEKEHIPETNTK